MTTEAQCQEILVSVNRIVELLEQTRSQLKETYAELVRLKLANVEVLRLVTELEGNCDQTLVLLYTHQIKRQLRGEPPPSDPALQ